MPVNVGTIDRAARLLAGAALVGLAATGHIGAWGYIGLLFVGTGLAGRCPAYLPFGLSTCATQKK